uniref:Uncharacterized protein n=1 Tax=Plectus sambesii TaxID=2011161 RepID=A0A914WNB6_9BILA
MKCRYYVNNAKRASASIRLKPVIIADLWCPKIDSSPPDKEPPRKNMSTAVFFALVIQFLLLHQASATSCYNYQIPSDQDPKDSSTGSTQKDCTIEFRAQQIFSPGVCIKSSFKDRNGAEVIMGACYPRCPSVMNGKQCIYPDEDETVRSAIADLTRLPDALNFCCCETDYCNSAGKIEIKWMVLFSLAAVLTFTLQLGKI